MARVLLVLAFLVFVCSFGFILLTAFGQRTMMNETVTLAPGESKSYYLPPGMVYVHLQPDAPVDDTCRSLNINGFSHGITGGTAGIGSPFVTNYTIINPGLQSTNVSLQLTTGMLNPLGYVWFGW